MHRYREIKQLGTGTFSTVFMATSIDTNENVAIKKMKKKYSTWDDCLSLGEIECLRRVSHPNIIKLKEVVRENDVLYLIFEHVDANLYQIIKNRKKLLPESVVIRISFQIFLGLSYMHKHGFFHRDMKPENLLCSGPDCIKIADFGLAREILSQPPYTDYVSTRWYRSPEVMLHSTCYSSPIDIWSVGCIIAELCSLEPLFPGTSEIDQLFRICQVLGTPYKNDWPEGHALAVSSGFRWPTVTDTSSLRQLLPSASCDVVDIIASALVWNPRRRITALLATKHPCFLPVSRARPALTPQLSDCPRIPVNIASVLRGSDQCMDDEMTNSLNCAVLRFDGSKRSHTYTVEKQPDLNFFVDKLVPILDSDSESSKETESDLRL